MFLAVRALITFNAAHLNGSYERLPRIYEKRRELDLVPRRVLVVPEKARARGSSVSAAPIYILCYTSPISNSVSTIRLSSISYRFSISCCSRGNAVYTRYNKSRSLNTILRYEIRSPTLRLTRRTLPIDGRHVRFAVPPSLTSPVFLRLLLRGMKRV